MRVTKYLNQYANVNNERYVLENGKWSYRFFAIAYYRIITREEVFNANGESLGEMETNVKTERDEMKEYSIDDDMLNIVQINFDFELIPNSGCYTMDEVSNVARLLNNTFDGETFNVIHREGYREPMYLQSRHYAKMDSSEISTIGHSRIIYNVVDKMIDAKTYHENYQRAIKKYPKHVRQITYLYKCNIEFLTKNKKYLNV
jgi:hypothetical protein